MGIFNKLIGVGKGVAGFMTGNPLLAASGISDVASDANPKNKTLGKVNKGLGIASMFGGGGATEGATEAVTGATEATGGGVGKALGFTGEGGGFMKGMENVSSLKNMFGGGKDSAPMPEIQQAPIGANTHSGFDVADYAQPLPGYADGGIPNQGKPAVIVDEETGQPTGRMNEQGAEVIVPTGKGGISSNMQSQINNMKNQGMDMTTYDSPTPSQSIVPQKQGLDMTAFGSPTPSQNPVPYGKIREAEEEEEEEDLNKLKQYKEVVFPTEDDNKTKGKHDKISTIRIEKKEEGIAPKDKTQMSDVIRGLARMTGYYYDMRKNRYGLGKSALTMWLDNIEGKEAQDAKNTATTKSATIKSTGDANLLAQKHANDMELQRLKNKNNKTESLEKEKMRVREEASEDWDNLDPAEKEKYTDTPEGKKNYINDRLNIAIESKVPEYKKETVTEKKFAFKPSQGWKKDVVTEIDKRTGKYIPSDNAQADETNTIAEGSTAIDKKTGKKIVYKKGKWVLA